MKTTIANRCVCVLVLSSTEVDSDCSPGCNATGCYCPPAPPLHYVLPPLAMTQVFSTDNNQRNVVELGKFIDVNGDGLPDLVYSFSTRSDACATQTQCVYINTKQGWLESSIAPHSAAVADPRVGAFLDALNLTHYAAHFASHEVDYETLLGLTDADLKEVGVKALGARRRILQQAAGAAPYKIPWALQSGVGGGSLTDINGDGLPDILVGWYGASQDYAAVYLNTGKGFCVASENGPAKSYRIANFDPNTPPCTTAVLTSWQQHHSASKN